MPSSNPIISFHRVSCTYRVRHGLLSSRDYQALREIDFTLYQGETLGVIGRNGAGKSTLLRLIAGIILPSSGKIIRRSGLTISLLTLQLGFSQELSGRDNAILGAMLLGHTRKQAESRLDRIIDFSELRDWIDEPLKTYSSGMRARLGFSVAMEMSPDILLVDEVLGVGDESFRRKSTRAMKEKMRSGQTVVFVSHQPELHRQLCTRVAWIEDGSTRMVNTPEQVLDAYREHQITLPPAKQHASFRP